MSTSGTDQARFERRLRLSLATAFQSQAHLVSEEMLLHGALEVVTGDKFQARAVALLQAEPTIAQAELAALIPLGPDVWAEASSIVESHFESDPAIPDRDLAVYAPDEMDTDDRKGLESFDQLDEIARLALAAGAVEVEAVEEGPDEPLSDPESEVEAIEEASKEHLPKADPEVEEEFALAAALAASAHEHASEAPNEEISEINLPEPDGEPVVWDLAAAMDPSRLTPLPLVAAALEAVGLDEDQYGFLLRYGTLAPSGRTPEIKIAGLGMAEFANRAAEWFSALGASKFPIQVIDDGSGELTVYLLESVPV